MRNNKKSVVLIGPFPPPVHGMAKNLKVLKQDILTANVSLLLIDTSPGKINRDAAYHFKKACRVCMGAVRLFLEVITSKSTVYIPPDAGFGAVYTLAFVLICKLTNTKLILHHRSFLYINKKTILMRLITLCQPNHTQHVFLCALMMSKFEDIYGKQERPIIVSNAQYVTPISKVNEIDGKIILGHLSNLGYGKGIKQVFDLCEVLIKQDVQFHLKLAGPAEDDEIASLIENFVIDHSDHVTYYGGIYGEEKEKFFSSLDLFLFPTEYVNEAQPNVLFEAMAGGIPVLTVGVGCIAGDVCCDCGTVYASQEDFLNRAPSYVCELAADRRRLHMLKESTLLSIKAASDEARDGYNHLLALLGVE